MIEPSRLAGSVVPFARRWHVIHELDLGRLVADHARLRSLCDQLEACADALPGRPSRELADRLCRALHDMVMRQERDEDDFLEEMFARDLGLPLTHVLLEHVRRRHIANASHAQDLIRALQPVEERDRVSIDTMGYMLRCFFDGCRRAMDFEELAIIALGQHRLTRDARDMLIAGLDQRSAA